MCELNWVKLCNSGLKIKLISFTDRVASKDTCFKSGQEWLENNCDTFWRGQVIKSQLDPYHTRHFFTQYCNKKIKRYLDNLRVMGVNQGKLRINLKLIFVKSLS